MQKRLDGGYGWAVVVAHFIVCSCVFGTSKTNGVMFVYFQDAYNATYAATSAISLSQRLTECSTALIFSFLAERYTARPIMLAGGVVLVAGALMSVFAKSVAQLTFTFGILIGLGTSMVLYPSGQMLPKYFDKKIAIATAFAFTGGSFGPLVMPFVIKFAIDQYGLSGSFYILAAVSLHVLISALLMRPVSFFNKKKKVMLPSNQLKDGKTKVEEGPTFKSMLRVYKSCFLSANLMLYYFGYLAASVAVANCLSYQQANARDHGITDPTLLGLLTSIWGITELITRIIFAFVLQSGVLPPYRYHQISSILFAVVLIFYPILSSYLALAFCTVLVAILWSVVVISLLPILRDIVGIELCSPALGLLCIPSLLGYSSVQLAGFARDYTGNFLLVFYTCAVILILGAISIEIIAWRSKQSIFHKISALMQKYHEGQTIQNLDSLAL